MCFIAGKWNKGDSLLEYGEVINFVRAALIRGRDAIGACLVGKRNTRYIRLQLPADAEPEKIALQIWNGIMSDAARCMPGATPWWKYFVVITRAIPEPELVHTALDDIAVQRDTQPFVNGSYVVAHNGTIANDARLRELFGLHPDSKVDSAILPGLCEKVGVVDAFKKVKGSYAASVYDIKEDVLHLVKNFQPLYYMDRDDEVIFSSMTAGFKWFDKDCAIQEVPPYASLKFSRYERGDEIATTMFCDSLYNKEENNKVVVCCSGGMDSVTTARLYQATGHEIFLVNFKYGQAAEEAESLAVKKIAELLQCGYQCVDVKDLFKQVDRKSLLLTLKEAPCEYDALLDAESTMSYVGCRNLIFASIVSGIADSIGATKVALGLSLTDSGGYPDNGLPFLEHMDGLLPYAVDWHN